MLQSVDANGVNTTNTYDTHQRLLTSNVAGQITSRTYNMAGQIVLLTRPDGTYVSYTYGSGQYGSAFRQLRSVSDSLGNSINYTRDAAGVAIVETVNDPAGILVRTLKRTVDGLGRVYQIDGRE